MVERTPLYPSFAVVWYGKDLRRTPPMIGGGNLPLVGLFIPDLLKGKKPRRTKHIPKVPKMLVFTKNFETRKEYDYGKVHY